MRESTLWKGSEAILKAHTTHVILTATRQTAVNVIKSFQVINTRVLKKYKIKISNATVLSLNFPFRAAKEHTFKLTYLKKTAQGCSAPGS